MVRVAVIDNGICEKYIKRGISHYKIVDNILKKEMNQHLTMMSYLPTCSWIELLIITMTKQ